MKLSNRVAFSISFPCIPRPVAGVWSHIYRFLKSNQCLPKGFSVSQMAGHPSEIQSEQPLKVDSRFVGALIESRKLTGFHVCSGNSRKKMIDFFLLGSRDGGHTYRLGSVVESEAKAPDDWRPLIESLITEFPAVCGLQQRSLYSMWQNQREIHQFYGELFGTLPPGSRQTTQKAGLSLTPQPDRVFVDISLNPGRAKELDSEVIFIPTAEMWLGPRFWQYAKCSKAEVLAADLFIEKRDTPHYLYLKCWPRPFTRPDGEQGRMQQELWRLFFHEDCEWPPGSGIICDEPMYGPPELMPSM
jgi:hypothetical protein